MQKSLDIIPSDRSGEDSYNDSQPRLSEYKSITNRSSDSAVSSGIQVHMSLPQGDILQARPALNSINGDTNQLADNSFNGNKKLRSLKSEAQQNDRFSPPN